MWLRTFLRKNCYKIGDNFCSNRKSSHINRLVRDEAIQSSSPLFGQRAALANALKSLSSGKQCATSHKIQCISPICWCFWCLSTSRPLNICFLRSRFGFPPNIVKISSPERQTVTNNCLYGLSTSSTFRLFLLLIFKSYLTPNCFL